MTSIFKSAALQNRFLFELFNVYTCILFIYFFFLDYLYHAMLAAALPASILVFALMSDVLLHGLRLIMGAKVSWLAFQLSSALQQFKWTCSESTLKNYFSLSRR